MKGFKLAAAAGAVAIGLGAAGAAKADNTVTFELLGTVGGVCGVYGDSVNTINVDFGDLGVALNTDWITTGDIGLHYVCNIGDGFNRDVSSVNGGFLRHADGDEVEYQMFHSDENGLDLGLTSPNDYTQLTGLIADTGYLNSDFTSFVDEYVRFRARGVIDPADGSVTKTAGDYSDTVTVAVTSY